MTKRLLSVMIVLVILSLAAVFPASAVSSAPVEISAQVNLNLSCNKTIYFDNSTTKWKGPVQFYIYDPEANDELIFWGTEQLNGTYIGNDIWAYDTSVYLDLDCDKQYCIIFSDNGTPAYTYDLVMDCRYFGDIAYVTGKSTDGPYDPGSSGQEARWRNSSLGPLLRIFGLGDVVGETCPAFTSRYQLFVDFLKNDLTFARKYSGKDDQTLIDDIKRDLGISYADVIAAIDEAGISVDWNPVIDSSIPGDADGDGEVTTLDITYIQRFLSFMDVPDSFCEDASDIDGDGEASSLDVTYIQRYLAYIDIPYPIG